MLEDMMAAVAIELGARRKLMRRRKGNKEEELSSREGERIILS
jgi:hypothetical protein